MIEKLKQIYMDGFREDGEKYADYFCSKNAKKSVVYPEISPVCSGYVIPKKLFDGKYCAYFSAIATLESERGKGYASALISKMLCRKFIDTDEVIKRRFGDIASIFKERGESEFRRLESDVVNEISATSGAVIATGGGAVLNESNVLSLRKNSRIYFIDRPLKMLISTEDRPLAKNKEDIEKLYNARIELYRKYGDRIIDGAPSPEDIAKEIISDFEEYYS
jgi:shikimate kinase